MAPMISAASIDRRSPAGSAGRGGVVRPGTVGLEGEEPVEALRAGAPGLAGGREQPLLRHAESARGPREEGRAGRARRPPPRRAGCSSAAARGPARPRTRACAGRRSRRSRSRPGPPPRPRARSRRAGRRRSGSAGSRGPCGTPPRRPRRRSRDREAGHGLRELPPSSVSGRPAYARCTSASQRREALLALAARLVDAVVHHAAEGVEGEDRAPLLLGQDAEGVVEARPAPPGDARPDARAHARATARPARRATPCRGRRAAAAAGRRRPRSPRCGRGSSCPRAR